MASEITYPLAFLAGILSFLSPCVLPLVPSYVSYITGVSFDELTTNQDRKKIRLSTALNSLLFILGFTTIFLLLGVSTSYLGRMFGPFMEWLRIGGGILVITMGLFISGVINIDFLMRERRLHIKKKPSGYLGSYLVGTSFGAGWTPCIGPILGSILMVASVNASMTDGLKLLTAFSAGLAIPFFISALAFNSFLSYSKVILRHMKTVKAISGAILILFGVILLTDNLGWLAAMFPDFGLSI